MYRDFHKSEFALKSILERLQTPGYTGFVESTVPLFVSNEKTTGVIGSGVLFQIAEHHFLITAAHVTDAIKKAMSHGYLLYTAAGQPQRESIQFNRFPILSTLEQGLGREDDPYDISVITLPAEVVRALLPGRRFLHLPEIDVLDGRRAGSLYVVFGYPSGTCAHDREFNAISTEPLLYGTRVSQRELEDLNPPRNPKTDYLLDFSQEFGVRLDGQDGGPPDPKGISGCGIWRVIDSHENADRWSPDQVRLVGIEHSWSRRKHYVRGTTIGIALTMILRQYPELDRPASISLPPQ